MLAPPVRTAGETPPAQHAPALGAQTDELLHELGYDDARIEALRRAYVI
jgi:crotonobetainyl-CoA:carnitine CoA-transferase CaiB-like acyl-CoA transferase